MITNNPIINVLGDSKEYFMVSATITSVGTNSTIPTATPQVNNTQSTMLGIMLLVLISICAGSIFLYEFYLGNRDYFTTDGNNKVNQTKADNAKMLGWILSGISFIFVAIILLLIAIDH
jgi:ABC-type Fe3+ transport system permease subunit